jgi:serine/threonine protein kinase
MRQLLLALESLAKLGVVHRDVKPENLMVTEASASEGATGQLTLIDFGYAALLDGAGGMLEGVAGSPEYAAPEVLSWLEVEADETGTVEGEHYGAGCDIWSVGVTAHVLLCAELPFDLPEEADEASMVAAARNIDLTFERKEWAVEGMDEARSFVRACMTTDQAARPTARALLEHAWVAAQPCSGPNAKFVEMLDESAAIERATN